MSESRRERGERLFRQIVGAPTAPPQGSSDFMDITIEHLFGEVWARDDLSVRERRLVTLAALIVLGQTAPFSVHLRHALESGDLAPTEIQGLVIHLAHYAGWPLASAAQVSATQVIAEFEKARADASS